MLSAYVAVLSVLCLGANPELVKKSIAANVLIDVGPSWCSGVVIKNNIVVTAAHCYNKDMKVIVDKTYRVLYARKHETKDIMVLLIDGMIKDTAPITLKEQMPGQDIYIIGNIPDGDYIMVDMVTPGIVSKKWKKDYAVSADIIKGMSGGGAYTDAGELFCIIVTGFPIQGLSVGSKGRCVNISHAVEMTMPPEKSK